MIHTPVEVGALNLVSQSEVGQRHEPWHRDVLDDLEQRLSDPGFPCIFSRNAYKKKLVKFIFVDRLDDDGIQYLADGLQRYVELSRAWDGRIDTAYPLIVAFSLTAVQAGTVAEYQAHGWRILQALHDVDPMPWPEGIDVSPDSTNWSMCFDGMPLFCNMSNAAHVERPSRNLGRHFILVINPRERFDIVAGDTPRGRKSRANIRQRIDKYDAIPHSDQLGSYGEGALEWQQYGLADDNSQSIPECPFKFNGQ
ncbi:YqcI/YcgG family protein [Cryobacterium sp. MDB1-18-2]|nr:YqcI/YcgG family protein [Cryobacterium sp. MDB2-A-1]TFC10970.1 YqcI/YcgG family protein [Cryobacterium sp. MDB2-33-2]TFC16091.1 YqcI/YcgG family protein [Cryobacterium sp. MDB2-A-2]TFC19017.1 YqcI/YcgG family protein [Cryobacterium sp. MDB2-10]TFC32102.1 YqcI/YcgG family protein [Cryobacterium sp. MDB1-18-2]TFC42036.1 YqcI/YcgG family protein [Cryobacterium sp. MDB1-18-1]